jgi:hypothetical protein
MKQKKVWQKPQLTTHGSVEEVTQVNFSGLKVIKGFIAAGQKLSAVLSM